MLISFPITTKRVTFNKINLHLGVPKVINIYVFTLLLLSADTLF